MLLLPKDGQKLLKQRLSGQYGGTTEPLQMQPLQMRLAK